MTGIAPVAQAHSPMNSIRVDAFAVRQNPLRHTAMMPPKAT
jgi:hypothetical protein